MFDEKQLCHWNNILQKAKAAPSEEIKSQCNAIIDGYQNWVNSLDLDGIEKGDFSKSVAALNQYVEFAKDIEKSNKYFNWRSDFAGSVIPEYLYRICSFRLGKAGLSPLFSTRNSIVEVTLASTAAGGWNVRHKNQDLCIGTRTADILLGGNKVSFIVPEIVFEVKTNLDINKLNGLDFSAERLKRSFPAATYMVLTETIDFSLNDNYAAGSIDEIYVGRRQLRSLSRKSKAPLSGDVFKAVVEDVVEIIRRASIKRGHVYERLAHGRLINVQ
jgi:hypothetical protein